MKEFSKEELIEEFESFLNDFGMWNDFKEWVENRGYLIADLGFTEDEI